MIVYCRNRDRKNAASRDRCGPDSSKSIRDQCNDQAVPHSCLPKVGIRRNPLHSRSYDRFVSIATRSF